MGTFNPQMVYDNSVQRELLLLSFFNSSLMVSETNPGVSGVGFKPTLCVLFLNTFRYCVHTDFMVVIWISMTFEGLICMIVI